MANGVLVDEATYYNDPETYTGNSGNETNQWCIEDVYDFLTLRATASDRTYYKLINDINFNDHPTYKYGFYEESITGNSNSNIYLDGAGHNIYNAIFYNYTSITPWFYIGKFENTNFVNMILINCTSSSEIISGPLYNCNFGVFLSNSSIVKLFYNNTKQDCTFNIEGKSLEGIYLARCTLNRCHINVDIETSNQYLISASSFPYQYTLSNSYITGKIKTTASGAPYLFDYGVLSNSYVALEVETDSETINVGSISVTNSSFVDTDLMPKLQTGSPANLYRLTTEQAKNAEYLQSIGFLAV